MLLKSQGEIGGMGVGPVASLSSQTYRSNTSCHSPSHQPELNEFEGKEGLRAFY